MAVVAPAQAEESALRERTHARIAAILDGAVGSGLYSTAQRLYVTSALLPAHVDAKRLPSRLEQRTVADFWEAVTDGTGVSEGQVRTRLASGATLMRATGEYSGVVQERLYGWLAKPVAAAYLREAISKTEQERLRGAIARAVDRLMRQPGGGSGRVVASPRRNEPGRNEPGRNEPGRNELGRNEQGDFPQPPTTAGGCQASPPSCLPLPHGCACRRR
jgi:hypothetical protein